VISELETQHTAQRQFVYLFALQMTQFSRFWYLCWRLSAM